MTWNKKILLEESLKLIVTNLVFWQKINTLHLLLYSAQGRTVRPNKNSHNSQRILTSSLLSNNDLKQEDIIRGELVTNIVLWQKINTLYLLLYSAQGRTVRPNKNSHNSQRILTSSLRSNNDLKQEDIIRGELVTNIVLWQKINTLYLLLYSAQGRTVRPNKNSHNSHRILTSSSRSNNDLKQEDINRGDSKFG